MAIGSCLLTSFFSVLFLVFSAGSFDSIAKQPHAVLQLWLLGFPTVVFLTVYLFGHVWSQKSFWFDRICVDQLNLDVKHQTLQAIPAFVAGSSEMLVLWDETYSSRLWCNYELAVHAKTAASPDAIKAVPVWIPVWTLVLFGFPAILNCLVYEESVSLHPETPLSLFLGWFQTYTLPESIYSMLIGFPVSWFCLQKLRRHKLMLDQMSDFDLRNAKCTEESDRQVIEENVLNLFDEALEPPLSVSLDALDMLPKMSTLEDGNADSGLPLVSMEQIREIRHITSYPTKSEVIDQFNAYVRGPLRDSVVNAMGEENYMSFKLCMVASLPSFLAGLVAVLGCQGHQDCMIGASFEGFTSDWKYMMANAVIYLLLNPVNLSLMFPLNLRINQLVERHVTGRCQILVGSFLSGFTIALLDVVSNTHMALVLLASTQSSWVFSAALVACFILQVSNLWLLFFKRRPHHSNSRVLSSR